MDSKTIPFTYLIGWAKHNKWYYGVRYAKGCNPKDLWSSYFTSSHHVSTLRVQLGEPDVIHVRKTFASKKSALKHEHVVLRRMNVITDDKFVNKNIGIPPTQTRELSSSWRVFYNPDNGILLNFKGTKQQLNNKMFLHIKKDSNEFPYTLGKNVPDQFHTRINNGHRSIIWDTRLIIPTGWVTGYLYTEKQHASAKKSGLLSRGKSREQISHITKSKMKEKHWLKHGGIHPLLGIGHSNESKIKMSISATKYYWCLISPSGFIFDSIPSLPIFCKEMGLSLDSLKKYANTDTPVSATQYSILRNKPTQAFFNTLGWLSFKTPLF